MRTSRIARMLDVDGPPAVSGSTLSNGTGVKLAIEESTAESHSPILNRVASLINILVRSKRRSRVPATPLAICKVLLECETSALKCAKVVAFIQTIGSARHESVKFS